MTTKMVEVVAIEAGHDGRIYRRAGERFHVDENRLKPASKDNPHGGATWFVRPEDEPAPTPAAKSKLPPGAGPLKGSAVGEQ